jgi:TonB family protein
LRAGIVLVGRQKWLQFVCLAICIIALPGWAPSYSVDEWKRRIAVRLHSKAHVPREARSKSGEVKVSFSLDRNGNLLSTNIDSGSRISVLDDAALEIIKDAQPFPPAPPEAADTDLKIAVTMDFVKPTGTLSSDPLTGDPLEPERLRGVMRSICRGC